MTRRRIFDSLARGSPLADQLLVPGHCICMPSLVLATSRRVSRLEQSLTQWYPKTSASNRHWQPH